MYNKNIEESETVMPVKMHADIFHRKFPTEPLEHKGMCNHTCGIVFLDGLNCTCCGYFIPENIIGENEK